jgi:hypothetical protein
VKNTTLMGVFCLGTSCSGVLGTKAANTNRGDSGGIDDQAEGFTFSDIEISPGFIDFGQVEVGSIGVADVLLSNGAGKDKLITNVYISGHDEFAVADALVLPFTIADQDATILSLTFEPAEETESAGTLFIGVAEAPGYAEIQIGGQGTPAVESPRGGDTGGGEGEGEGEPALSFDTVSLDFGSVGVEATATLPLTATNTGTSSLLMTHATITNDAFDIGTGFSVPAVIEAGESVTIPVRFTPPAATLYSAIIDFTTDPPLELPYIDLVGAGDEGSCAICAPVLNLSDETLSLTPPHIYGCTASGAITVGNDGDQDLDITGVRVFNASLSTCGSFSRSWAGPAVLVPGERTTIVVDYVATESCMEEARPSVVENMMRIRSDDPERAEVFISLSASALLCE